VAPHHNEGGVSFLTKNPLDHQGAHLYFLVVPHSGDAVLRPPRGTPSPKRGILKGSKGEITPQKGSPGVTFKRRILQTPKKRGLKRKKALEPRVKESPRESLKHPTHGI